MKRKKKVDTFYKIIILLFFFVGKFLNLKATKIQQNFEIFFMKKLFFLPKMFFYFQTKQIAKKVFTTTFKRKRFAKNPNKNKITNFNFYEQKKKKLFVR